jgi:predicted ester cyclase
LLVEAPGRYSVADGRDTALRLVEAFNTQDEEAVRTLCAPNSRLEAPGGIRLQGREALARHAQTLFTAFPGARVTAQNDLVDGPRVMQEFIFEGTHGGPLARAAGTVQPTGKRVVVRGVLVGRYERRLAIDVRLYYDRLDMLTQLGLAP